MRRRTPISYLRQSPFGELVTGTAHQAHPTDITAPLGLRFAGRSILAVHTALERAATLRVHFGPQGEVRLGGIRNIKQRGTPEFADVLRSEATAIGADWVVVIMATGWQAVLGQRAARPEPHEAASPFARHRLMFETPEVVVPRAHVDRVYTAVDHPVLDKSVVFSVRRRDIEEIVSEVRRCGLGVASVRVAIAAQLESWLSSQGDIAMAQDLLLSDGLSALLLNAEQGDFVPPRGAIEAEHPRQSVQRPGAVEEDISRFIAANGDRSIMFVGSEDLCVAIKQRVPAAEILRTPAAKAHDTQEVALGPTVQHELLFDAREVRPALPRSWRRFVLGYLVVLSALVVLAISNLIYGVRAGYDSFQLERESENRIASTQQEAASTANLVADYVDLAAIQTWVAANYHAQRFCYRLLREIPEQAGLDKLVIEMHDGQIALTLVVLGDQETQLATHRAIERAVKELRFKIGGEDAPVGSGSRAVQYRLHIIVPDAAEVGA